MFTRDLPRKGNRLSIQRLQDYPGTLLIGSKKLRTAPKLTEALYRLVGQRAANHHEAMGPRGAASCLERVQRFYQAILVLELQASQFIYDKQARVSLRERAVPPFAKMSVHPIQSRIIYAPAQPSPGQRLFSSAIIHTFNEIAAYSEAEPLASWQEHALDALFLETIRIRMLAFGCYPYPWRKHAIGRDALVVKLGYQSLKPAALAYSHFSRENEQHPMASSPLFFQQSSARPTIVFASSLF